MEAKHGSSPTLPPLPIVMHISDSAETPATSMKADPAPRAMSVTLLRATKQQHGDENSATSRHCNTHPRSMARGMAAKADTQHGRGNADMARAWLTPARSRKKTQVSAVGIRKRRPRHHDFHAKPGALQKPGPLQGLERRQSRPYAARNPSRPRKRAHVHTTVPKHPIHTWQRLLDLICPA